MAIDADRRHEEEAPPGVVVFGPVVGLSVTLEQGIEDDQPEVHLHPHGQGFWVSHMARLMGRAVTLCTALGGETGATVAHLLRDEGIELRAVALDATTAATIEDRRSGERRCLAATPSPRLGRHAGDDLHNVTLAAGIRSGVAVLTGTEDRRVLPPDTFRRLAHDLQANGVPVVADLSGPQLAAAVAGGLTFVKVSHSELVADGWAEGDEVGALHDGAQRLREAGAANVVVSRADEPALAVLDDEAVLVRGPVLEALEHRGAGDAMTGAVAAALAGGAAPAEAVVRGVAAGALSVTRHGLATGVQEAIEGLCARVHVEPFREGGH